ncbi:SEC14-like protein 2 [Uloborus diversus]|uniref:SEC14-like protein 2 n=1 Tax=Uloborus diversus TaxID=327109 RepID=UPI00240960DB|nr:SEC14-like protein 2 [Uloborus diversus]
MSTFENPSPEERQAIEELRSRIENDLSHELKTDKTLYYRFLKARDFNVDQAEAMLRKHITWRKASQIENILNWKYQDVITNYITSSPIGFDKEGSPVRYWPVGNLDLKGIAKTIKVSEAVRLVIYACELDLKLMKERNAKLGKSATQCAYIYDLEHLTFSKATDKDFLETSLMGLNIFQDNYPERVKAIYVINASVYFTILFSVIKTVLAGALIKKIRVFGTDGWREALLKDIDEEELPAFLGGKKTDPDGNPLCKTLIMHGGLIPKSYYRTKTKSLSQNPEAQKLVVNRLSKAELELEVQEPGYFIQWEFETQSHDIGIGLFYKDPTDNKRTLETLVPSQRIDTTLGTETGMYKCENIGTYILVFDNSYSWLHSKEVYCIANVVKPSFENNNL